MHRGAEVSAIHRDPSNVTAAQAVKRQNAKGTGIHTYRYRSRALDLDLNRMFCWVFLVADVPHSIFGIDLMQHFELIVNARAGRRWTAKRHRLWPGRTLSST